MSKSKSLALFFACLAVGALNETFLIFRDPNQVGKWQAKSIAIVFTMVFIVVSTYFWRKKSVNK